MNNYLIISKKDQYKEIAKEKKILLGNWCFQEKYIGDINDNVIKYHWDDREKLEKDTIYIENFSKLLSEQIGLKLNKLHKINKSKKYWSIILNFWLHTFLSSTFDLWENLQAALQNRKILVI